MESFNYQKFSGQMRKISALKWILFDILGNIPRFNTCPLPSDQAFSCVFLEKSPNLSLSLFPTPPLFLTGDTGGLWKERCGC